MSERCESGTPITATSHGTFSGDLRTAWITAPANDQLMRLLESFSYTDPELFVWGAPKDHRIHGTSIPRPLWSLLGSPYCGMHRRAAIVHEVARDHARDDSIKRRAADRMFYHACRASGCSVSQATLLYLGVRMAAAWPSIPQWAAALHGPSDGPRLRSFASEERMEADFRLAAEMAVVAGVVDDIYEIERMVDLAIAAVTNVDVL
jgi:hypothetical protein